MPMKTRLCCGMFLSLTVALSLAPGLLAADAPPRLTIDKAHNARVRALAFSPDGKAFAAGGWLEGDEFSTVVRVWSLPLKGQ